ncbi:hypothetical protein BDZ97DRAFT_1912656 [Flammula alnicola]|nr:hypothetical protein BDZ97DRAFT_1912656 [Flammula alnicola]
MTVEDSSPLITYAPTGSWIDTPANDALAAAYSAGSYHSTAAQGATATLTFNGTGLSIFGAHRPNYGTYSITMDGQTIASGSSQAIDASTRQLLGAVSGLAYGTHTAILTNTGGAPVDIDWVDFETQIGGPGAVGIRKTFDNTDSTIVYSPSASAWQSNTNPEYFNGTLSFSQVPGASASLTFSGESVAVYGTVSPDHANLVVTVDGQTQNLPGGSGGFASEVHPNTLLYYRSDLSTDGDHTLVLSGSSQAPGSGPFIDLDMITVFAVALPDDPASATSALPTPTPIGTAAAENTLTPSSTLSASTASVSTSRMSTGVIVGAVLGGFIALLLVLGIIGFLFLQRRRNRSVRIEKSMISVSPILPMQRDPKALEAGMTMSRENTVFPFPLPPQRAASLRHSIAPSYYSDPSYTGHSRDGSAMSIMSSTPLVRGVPVLNIPQPRSNIPRKPAPASSGFNFNSLPVRPSNRPPTMDFTQMETPR